MSTYTVTCRGGLLTKAGLLPMGASVEMSEKDANSLPGGTVALKAPEPKPTPKNETAKAAKDAKP